jgi:hypothetical protein
MSCVPFVFSIYNNLDWWRQLVHGELSAGEVASAAGWAVVLFGAAKFTGGNSALNKQARDALKKALREAGIQWNEGLQQQFHRFISGQGIEGFRNLHIAAQEWIALRFGR